jgi:hypothetical protein
MITLLLFTLLLAGSVFVLGAGAVYLVLLLAFKAIWFGVSLLFSLGWGVVIAALIAALIIFKFAGVLLLLAGIGAIAFVAWLVLAALGGSARRPAASYSYETRRGEYRGASMRAATMNRLNAALNRLDERMDDLERVMRRRQ